MFDKIKKIFRNDATMRRELFVTDPGGWETGSPLSGRSQTASMKISAVSAAVEIRSDSIGKLPIFIMDGATKKHIKDHYLIPLLTQRPNEAMTPFTLKKMAEVHRLQWGNAYWLIVRNGYSATPREIIPLHPDNVQPYMDDKAQLWYIVTNPRTGEKRKLRSWDVVHFKGYSEDGITGISVLSRAAQTITTALEQQRYESKFYQNSARPSGVLTATGLLDKDAKNKIREEWEKMYSGIDNRFRTAVLDNGMAYATIAMNHRDAQFIESKAITVEDISRFYGVQLYKLQAGKQSYDSNEQNSIEYTGGTLQPAVTQMEQEMSYKMLFDTELRAQIEARMNMNAEVRADMATRGAWYEKMRINGLYSVNDILALEDMPAVEGGDDRLASLNYVPLELFKELSIARNAKGGEQNDEAV